MAIISPGISPEGTLESAASFTVVVAQTRSTPRCGSRTSVVSDPAVTAPLAAMMALPCEPQALPSPSLSGPVIAIQRDNGRGPAACAAEACAHVIGTMMKAAAIGRQRASTKFATILFIMSKFPPKSPPHRPQKAENAARVSGHDFNRAISAARTPGLYRLRKNAFERAKCVRA